MPENNHRTQMKHPENVLEVEDLQVQFFSDSGIVKSVNQVSFCVPAGKIVGLVGESGCGKSVTSLSVMGLLPQPQGKIVGGSIRLNTGAFAYDLTRTPQKEMQKIRGKQVSMVFQEPMTALNPVLTVGKQIDEVIQLHEGNPTKSQVRNRTLEILKLVGIANPRGVYKLYPHQLSGGMRQRIMIGIALACSPKLLIADEPTTALDVTIQAQILDLIKDLNRKLGSSVLLITHDLGVVAEVADLVVVMYAGRVVEKGTVAEIFAHPAHPYTIALMQAKPVVGKKQQRLFATPGKVPNPVDLPPHCYFKERCTHAFEACLGDYPCEISLSPTHTVSCYKEELREPHHSGEQS